MTRRSAALAVVVVAACGQGDGRREAAPRAEVVARVDGEPVHADEVAVLARAMGVAPRVALERIVDERLLAREARRRGLVTADDEVDARWRASIQELVAREVEATNTPATVPNEVFAELFERRRVALTHDGLVEVVHALAAVEGDAGVTALDAARATASRFAARLRERYGERPTREQFEALAHDEFSAMRVEPIGPFDRTGQSPDGARFVEPFVRGAWALRDDAPLSPVVTTQFGAHVILRVGSAPPNVRPMAEVRARVVREGVEMRRGAALGELVVRLRAAASVRVSEVALGASPGQRP